MISGGKHNKKSNTNQKAKEKEEEEEMVRGSKPFQL